jgi:hypothetical protein
MCTRSWFECSRLFPRILALLGASCASVCASAQPASVGTAGAVEVPLRALRYSPDGTDFVITNGAEFFNRALYGGNTGFRIEAGDRPEFSLFLPGRGGNLRLAIASQKDGYEPRWLFSAERIAARYRPGSMLYEIRDPLLGTGSLTLTAIPLADGEGLVLRVETSGDAAPVRLLWAYGGANGDRGRRAGDLRGERDAQDKVLSLGEFFQLKPEHCLGNRFELLPEGFTLTAQVDRITGLSPSGGRLPESEATQWAKPTKVIEGAAPPGTRLSVADAGHWASPSRLISSSGKPSRTPVLLGEALLAPGAPYHLGLRRPRAGNHPPLAAAALPRLFEEAERHRSELAQRLGVQTPDAFINAAAAALAVAADAVWDGKQEAFMHGAIAWRIPLLGWRALYAGDALGWHDRTRKHFDGFAAKQNTAPVPVSLPKAEEKSNLSRNVGALHSNGDMSNSLYDMNLVAIDAFFRHLQWTGDLEYARRRWPVIERHLAWERRLFRRPFGADSLPLYEAYACIWASDELFYNGGGATHSSAYNYWHNQMAARVAKALGKDPASYEQEASLIRRALQRELWLPDRGWFAEYKDFLGRQSVHTSAALWTFYHTLDSEAASPREAWQMTRFVDTQLGAIPLRGTGVPEGNFTLPTSNWMPYQWSTNNVTLEESAHAALGYWQAGRADRAYPLLKGCLLDSMFMGTSPGNVGMTSASDVNSAETYRDFADSVGATARALVEGLFGIKPDLLVFEFRIRPGFPADWEHARIRHPDIGYAFKREGLRETYEVETRLPKPPRLLLEVAALRDRVAGVTVNGQPASWRTLPDLIGVPRIEISAPPAARSEIVIEWQGKAPSTPSLPAVLALGGSFAAGTGLAKPQAIADPQGVARRPELGDHEVRGVAGGTLGHRTAFVQVAQGDLSWWMPLAFELRPAFEIVASSVQEAGGLRFRLRNNTANSLDVNATLAVGGKRFRLPLRADALQDSPELVLPDDGLPPGTQRISVDLGKGLVVEGPVVNWKTRHAEAPFSFEVVDLSPHLNDKVTQIFRNEYRSPRSPFCSLALPKQGIGGWCVFGATAEIDDSGLRAAAAAKAGLFTSQLGVPFQTPAQPGVNNIAFTSQWEVYPREFTLPLAGRASRVYLLMAGSTGPMQCRFDNGEVVATYGDGTTERLVLHSPTTWWPIERDYFIDDFAFARPEAIPPRLDLKTGTVRVWDARDFKRLDGLIPGGAATVLDLPLNSSKELKSLTLRTLGNDVVIGLMAATLVREAP